MIFEGGASAKETGLHGADVDVQDLRDLVVGKAFDLTQHHDGAEVFRKLL
jgi:hypothetical protein